MCGTAPSSGDGEHVAGSPSRVQILPGAPSPRHNTVSGPGRNAAVAGNQAEFTVTFKDAFGNPCLCPAAGSVPIGQSNTTAKVDGNKGGRIGNSQAAGVSGALEVSLVIQGSCPNRCMRAVLLLWQVLLPPHASFRGHQVPLPVLDVIRYIAVPLTR